MNRDYLDRLDQDDQDRFDLYGYPDPPWIEAEQAWREEEEAFEREGRYFDQPPERVSDDWLVLDDEELAA